MRRLGLYQDDGIDGGKLDKYRDDEMDGEKAGKISNMRKWMLKRLGIDQG